MTGAPAARPGSTALTVIFKGTNACNGGCEFCSVGFGGRRRIGWEAFEELAVQLERMVEGAGLRRVDFTFHGGEPTLLGPEFIDRACRRLERIPVDVAFSMQSNLLAVTDDLIAVARAHRIQIGSSIDPIGSGRRTRFGGDAFPRWLEGYERLVRAGFGVGAIFVVTRAALGREREVYRAAESLAVFGSPPGLQVNPIYPQGEAGSRQLITPEELGRFLVNTWRLWEDSGRSVQVSPLSSLARWFEEGPGEGVPLSCAFAGDCSRSHVGVDHDLRVAGCGRRLDSGAFLGMLGNAEMHAILGASAEKSLVAGRASRLAAGACRACRFFPLCHGGCPDDAALAGDIAGRTPWCEGYRALFEAMEAGVRCQGPLARPAGRVRQTLLFASLDASSPDPEQGPNEELERWLLPSEDGSALRFDAGLERILASRAARIVIWIHSRNLRSLTMWRDVLRDRRVAVGVFDAGSALPAVLNALNGLGAPILLDMASEVAREGGSARLQAAWQRFLSDPLWHVPIQPFAAMLRAGVERVQAPLADWRGLSREGCRVVVAEGAGDAFRRLAPDLAGREVRSQGAARWMAEHRGCIRCDAFSLCGGALAEGPAGCAAPLADLVHSIGARSAEIREVLREMPAA